MTYMVDTSVRNVAAAKIYAVINNTNDPSIATRFARRRFPHLSGNTNSSLLRFGMHLVEKYKQHQITMEAARKFSGDWKMSLEEIREEQVKILQRAYRYERTQGGGT